MSAGDCKRRHKDETQTLKCKVFFLENKSLELEANINRVGEGHHMLQRFLMVPPPLVEMQL